MENSIKKSILIIEDEMVTARSIEKSLISFGHEIAGIATNYDDGLVLVKEQEPDLVLMDIKLKGIKDGIELTQKIQTIIDVPIIYLTAHSDSMTIIRGLGTKPYGYVKKPYNDKELFDAIRMAFERYRYYKEDQSGKAKK